jgi:hypothetical protein
MDKHMFYLQHMNDDKTISRKLRHTIRARIATIYKTHFDQTNECLEMSVRPLEKSNAHKVTVATSNNSEEEEEEKEKTSDYSSNTSSDGSSDVSDVIRYSNDSFEHVSDNKNKRGIKRYRFSSKPGDLPTLAELSAEEQQMESETKQAAASSAGETKIDILVKQGEEEARLSTGSSDAPTSPRPQTGLGRDGLKQMIEQYNRSPRHDPSTSPMLAAGLWTGVGRSPGRSHTTMTGTSIPTGASMKIADVPDVDLDNIDADHPFHENHDDDYMPPTLELVKELVASGKVGGGGATNKGEEENVVGAGRSTSGTDTVDINVALAPSVVSAADDGTHIDDLNAILRRPSLNVLEIDGENYEDSDDGSDGEETKSEAKKHKSGGGRGHYFYVVLICSFLLIAIDVLFSFTILQPHAASKVNTSCFHSCSDQCLTVCSIDDHGTGSGGGGGGSGVEH